MDLADPLNAQAKCRVGDAARWLPPPSPFSETDQLNHIHQFAFRLAVTFNISLGRLKAFMSDELLDISKATTSFNDLLCSIGNKRPAS
jgi:hypothetical protein